mgnify:CR=1 FL=1|jgi:hypothetical protein
MEQVTRTNLPLAGRIQHGEQQIINHKKKVKELGYFIAKSKNNNMNFLLNRFYEKHQKQNFLNIQFFDETPLTIKKIRYNQSGAVCYCMTGTSKGKQKISNKWQDIECNSNCKYCIKQEGSSKPACNYEGTLKFLLPDISTDRIWIMKITGQQSISNLEEYINFQKYLGNTLIGTYTIFLNQIEQTNSEGKKFNNIVLDIVKAEDFNSNNVSFSQINTKNSSLSTDNVQTVDNSNQNQDKTQFENNATKETSKTNKNSKNNTQKATQADNTNAVTNSETTTENLQSEQSKITDGTYKEHCFLYDKEYKTFKKNGNETEYLIAKVTDINDKLTNVVISPEFRTEIEDCDIGTELIIEFKNFKGNIISKNIEILRKIPKKIVA